ncbi:MAG: coproporphyrinogen III oxidase, partial [Parabacteroides sp.]|nr:coproporphyrinogen III oxidase [Parabacteroides sp.]
IDREWNPSSLPIYIEGIENGHPTIESEDLDLCTRYNDFIITGLRTMWGVSFADIQTKFGRKLLSYCQKQAQPHINQGLLLQTGDKLILSKSGIFVSDGIMSDLLWV